MHKWLEQVTGQGPLFLMGPSTSAGVVEASELGIKLVHEKLYRVSSHSQICTLTGILVWGSLYSRNDPADW